VTRKIKPGTPADDRADRELQIAIMTKAEAVDQFIDLLAKIETHIEAIYRRRGEIDERTGNYQTRANPAVRIAGEISLTRDCTARLWRVLNEVTGVYDLVSKPRRAGDSNPTAEKWLAAHPEEAASDG